MIDNNKINMKKWDIHAVGCKTDKKSWMIKGEIQYITEHWCGQTDSAVLTHMQWHEAWKAWVTLEDKNPQTVLSLVYAGNLKRLLVNG